MDKMDDSKIHLYCDFCASKCSCGSEDCQSYPSPIPAFTEGTSDESRVRIVCPSEKAKLKELLNICQQNLQEHVISSDVSSFYMNIDYVTCFSNALVIEIIDVSFVVHCCRHNKPCKCLELKPCK